MRVRPRLSAIALSLIGLCAFANVALASSETPKIDAVVQEAAAKVMQEYAIAGMAIALSVEGKQRFYTFGVASKATAQAVTADTLFEVGSVSKLFTATLATYAQVKGRLSLSDNIAKYLPELQGTPLGKIALMHLATHTAGGFPLQVPDSVQNERQLMDYFKAWQPVYDAGSQRSYANPSIGLLGMITAKSLNMPYAQALEQQLLPALGMTNSYINVPADKMALYAQGYNKQEAPVRLNPGVLSYVFGMKSSARDLIHFSELNMGQGSVSEPLSRAMADTRIGYFKVGPMTQDLIWEQYPYPAKLETLIAGNANTMAYENNKAIALTPPLAPQQAAWINKTGSTNGFGAYVAFVPEKKQAVVILANKNYPNQARIELAYALFNAVN